MTKTPPNPEQTAQQFIMAIQALEEEIARGQSNLQMIEVQMQRLAETTMAVQELKNHEADDEIMVSIGSGVQLYVKLIDPKHVVTSIGAGFASERTLNDALKRFEEQQKQLTNIAQRQTEQLQNAQAKIDDYRSDLNQLIQTAQQQQK
ncbi:MAG: prefoldin subunit alpha [Promethearchaeota archaeon]